MNKENEQHLKSLKRYLLNNYNEGIRDEFFEGEEVSKYEDIPFDYLDYCLNGRVEEVDRIVNGNSTSIISSWKRYDDELKLKEALKSIEWWRE